MTWVARTLRVNRSERPHSESAGYPGLVSESLP